VAVHEGGPVQRSEGGGGRQGHLQCAAAESVRREMQSRRAGLCGPTAGHGGRLLP
jgi:hypothetical protein